MRRKNRTADEISATPEARAVRKAVNILGGAAPVGVLVERTHQAVQTWMETPSKMAPGIARIISKATDHQVTVTEMRPDVFGELTVQELGYLPKAYTTEQK